MTDSADGTGDADCADCQPGGVEVANDEGNTDVAKVVQVEIHLGDKAKENDSANDGDDTEVRQAAAALRAAREALQAAERAHLEGNMP